ncbi:hypothetical protein QR680_002777 [Steinernema hermaphroditum]|uniref:PAZ domain-containing protein n=1 Tax=Steinernema hermaphroditum TaxID=289476 RepID=A0AA39H416_9BILA|nr:hypothetical protein QR680_002777 [Steinernema hermaphroditum]
MTSQQCCELCGCVMAAKNSHEARIRDREVLFTKRSKEDAVATERKDKCSNAFVRIVEKFGTVFLQQPRHALYYDCQSILYAMQPIPDLEGKSCHELVLSKEELAGHPVFGDLDNVALELKKRIDPFKQDHSLQQFLELLTRRHALFTPSDHICYRSGTSCLLKAQLKGVFVQTTHSKHPHVFPIAVVTEETTVEKVFDEGQGGSITLIDYCELKYDIALRYPSAPLIVVNGNRQTNYYPWKCATSVAISV